MKKPTLESVVDRHNAQAAWSDEFGREAARTIRRYGVGPLNDYRAVVSLMNELEGPKQLEPSNLIEWTVGLYMARLLKANLPLMGRIHAALAKLNATERKPEDDHFSNHFWNVRRPKGSKLFVMHDHGHDRGFWTEFTTDGPYTTLTVCRIWDAYDDTDGEYSNYHSTLKLPKGDKAPVTKQFLVGAQDLTEISDNFPGNEYVQRPDYAYWKANGFKPENDHGVIAKITYRDGDPADNKLDAALWNFHQLKTFMVDLNICATHLNAWAE
jgi:hypothetical protein